MKLTTKRRPWVADVFALLVLTLVSGIVSGQSLAAGENDTLLIGALGHYRVQPGDTLPAIAVREDVGFVELAAANPEIDPSAPEAGMVLMLPTAHLLPNVPRRGVVINLGEQRLYHFGADGSVALTFPVGIGRAGCETPTGKTTIVAKRKNPTWVPPASIRAKRPELPSAIPPGPNNPLGPYALNLGWKGFVIHGTNRPLGIGRRVSHGCVRMHSADIERLFANVSIGTPVTVVDQPVKYGWSRGGLYLEVHPTQLQADEIETFGRFTPEAIPGLIEALRHVADERADAVDWALVATTIHQRRGIPVRIATW